MIKSAVRYVVRFSIRSLFLWVLLGAVVVSGTRWWLRVSEERRYLAEFDPTRNEIFDWPEDRQAIAKPVFDEMRAELMDAWFRSEEQKLVICNRYIDVLAQSHDQWHQPDLGRAFHRLGGILGLSDHNTAKLAARLGYDVETGQRFPLALEAEPVTGK